MTDPVVTTAPAIAYYIDRVKRRLATGVYPTVPVACFCGESKGQRIRSVDRYGIPHQMNFCATCGVISASPRMTADAMQRFYEADYRHIYDDGMTEVRRAVARGMAVDQGRGIAELVAQHGLTPSVVFELGCNEGSALDAFIESGAECLGVDYDETQVDVGQAMGRPVFRGGLDALELYGKRADLIILSHILEHVFDVEATLRRVRDLLSPTGLVFIALPTLYSEPQEFLYQNAHTYQFTARTLLYVMECCGFEDLCLHEGIISLWRRADTFRDKAAVDGPEVYRIAKYLNGGRNLMPMIRSVNKFDRADRLKHIEHAIKSGRPHLHALTNKHAGHAAVILAGGPSIDQEVEAIVAQQQAGAVIFTIERMLPWCLANGVMPTYVVAMDAHEDVIEAFDRLPDEPTYLVATQCHPMVLDRLIERRVHIFTTEQKDIRQTPLFDQHGVAEWSKVNAGGSVAICAMSLAMMFGCRHLHIFGFDCMLTTQSYANGIAGVGCIEGVLELDVEGYPDRVFKTTLPYLAFAQQFLELMELSRREGYLDRAVIHGDSLVTYIAKPNPVLG